METDPILQKADEHLFGEYFSDQLKERQDQEFYLFQGMARIKDLYDELEQPLKKKQDKIDEYTAKINDLKQNDRSLKEFDMAIEQYSHYNPDMDLEDILKHPRVVCKKPAANKYREQMRQLQVSLKIAKDKYLQEIDENKIKLEELSNKFALYAAVVGSSETLK